jgi:hypothetical protein
VLLVTLNEILAVSATAAAPIVLAVAVGVVSVRIINGTVVKPIVIAVEPTYTVPVLFSVTVLEPKSNLPVKLVVGANDNDWMVGLIFRVTVPAPDAASNRAPSAVPGTDAPETPPEAVAQLVVLFQFPLPPVTQKRFAMAMQSATVPLQRC